MILQDPSPREQPFTDLQYRAKSLAALIRSVSRRTAVAVPDLETFQSLFDRRLGVLVRVQSALARTPEWRMDLGELVTESLAQYRIDDDRYSIMGPCVSLDGGLAETVSLIIDELATDFGNGACEGRRLSVEWTVAARRLVWTWRVRGCPPKRASPELAFARELAERALPYQFGGVGELKTLVDGLVCRLEIGVGDGVRP